MFEVTGTNPSTPATAVAPVSAAPVLVTDVRRKGNLQVESPTMGVICISQRLGKLNKIWN